MRSEAYQGITRKSTFIECSSLPMEYAEIRISSAEVVFAACRFQHVLGPECENCEHTMPRDTLCGCAVAAEAKGSRALASTLTTTSQRFSPWRTDCPSSRHQSWASTLSPRTLQRGPLGKSRVSHGASLQWRPSFTRSRLSSVATHTVTGQKVAMKYISKAAIHHTKMKTRVKQEVEYMRTLKHPHIIKLCVSTTHS
jgi:hypothetical protein